MRRVGFLSPVADMPLAFLVERIGVACLADLRRIELQCDLPCKHFRLLPDAPLANLIGTQVKQGWDKGETSLGSPPIMRLSRSLPLRRWRTKSGRNARPTCHRPRTCKMTAERLSCWPLESPTGFGHRQKSNPRSVAHFRP